MPTKKTPNQAPKPLKVGFDFDGVLLYNPARIIRPVVFVIKKHLFKKRGTNFYFPKSKLAQLVFKIFHLSSIFPASGISDIKQLVKEGKIEAYLITARYDFLRDDLKKWIKRLDLEPYFVRVIHNEKNEQPHIYKERIIRDLNLDVFVEDNFDIVSHLSKKLATKVFWIYNILDKSTDYKHKFPSLKSSINYLFAKSHEKSVAHK